MFRKKMLVFLLIATVFLAACNNTGDDTPTPTRVGGGIGTPEVGITTLDPMYLVDWPYEMFEFWGATSVFDYELATPVSPAYNILDGKLVSCLGQDYIVLKVENTSGWSFQYLTMGASDGTDSWYVWPKDYWPFHYGGGECPLAAPHTHLGPGEEAFLYLPVDHSYGTTSYSIWVNMCTFVGDPPSESEHCVLQYYTLNLLEPISWRWIYVRVIEGGVCYFGPGSDFGTLGGLSAEDIVKLTCVGERLGWYLILHPLYERECWYPDTKLDITDPEVLKALKICSVPSLPPDCPAGQRWSAEKEMCIEGNCSRYATEKSCENNGCRWITTGYPPSNSGYCAP